MKVKTPSDCSATVSTCRPAPQWYRLYLSASITVVPPVPVGQHHSGTACTCRPASQWYRLYLSASTTVVPSVPVGQHHSGTVSTCRPAPQWYRQYLSASTTVVPWHASHRALSVGSSAADTAHYHHLLDRVVQRIPAPSDMSCDIPVRFMCVRTLSKLIN
jgi:hypothetical protein